jgi:hypothetical protein
MGHLSDGPRELLRGPSRWRPALSKSVSLYSFFGYCLLVIAAILAVRVLVQVFRPDAG